jgi:NAD(P)-dependent dehydrogenase (short-subunit alcohol dehydrogenase family)
VSATPLAGHRVLVTGGSMGIGYACAEAAARAGATVVIAARGAEALGAAAERLRGAGLAVSTSLTDVSDPAAVEALVQRMREAPGGLQGVVHAAAVLGPIGPATDQDPHAWWAAVRTNLFGTFLVATAAARSMGAGGSIVLFSGGGATAPFPNFSAYGAAKAAVVRFGETLAAEVAGRGIRVNCIAPGLVATRMQEQTLAAGDAAGAEYVAQLQERLKEGAVPATLAAEAAVFLLGPDSAGITGRLLAAPWDDWRAWPAHATDIAASDVFTLRRILPAERGFRWQ